MESKKLYDVESKIPQEEFKLMHEEASIHDTKFETRAVGWFEDSVKRFARNKASVVGAIIIAIFVLMAIIVPIFSPYNHVKKSDFVNGYQDKTYSGVLPKLFNNAGGFWDGTQVVSVGETEYKLRLFSDANDPYLINPEKFVRKEQKVTETSTIVTYKGRVDTYAVGVRELNLTDSTEYQRILDYEAAKGISYATNPGKSILKPLRDIEAYLDYDGPFEKWAEANGLVVNDDWSRVDNMKDAIRNFYNQRQYVYYKVIPSMRDGKYVDTKFEAYIEEGKTEPEAIYMKDSSGNLVFEETNNGLESIRIDYRAYYRFRYGFDPVFVFGANLQGQDIFLRLSLGAQFSLMLGIAISAVNFIIGLVYGAVSGYYGGKIDLIMERITDIISNVPTIIIMTIAQIQLTGNLQLKNALGPAGTIILALLLAFVFNGWVGVAGTTRMQFYRFKGQEYVLASRTLGANDRRLIFKHILPNAAGTLVTSSVLMIPGVIFSESSLSYLGIINFETSGICSVGALLAEGQQAGIATYPHVLLFPAIAISLLMISFNLFGNGLRDAFNTTLRGSEE
ncbi:MAG: ABC transporter permease [Bacilli bacterium]|nr:ABC transporter permease [Bacilli bacterium]